MFNSPSTSPWASTHVCCTRSSPRRTAYLPTTRVNWTWRRPRLARSGSNRRPSRARPSGAKTTASATRDTTGRSSGTGSDAVEAELVGFVGELARVLHQEAGLTDELTRSLRLDPTATLAAIGL